MGIFSHFKSQPKQETKLGGNRAALFVYATEALENMAFISNAVSLVTYFFGYMNFSLTKSATTLTNFMGASFLLALFGGFISDTFLSRFKTCVLFGCIELVGYALLAIQAHFHQLRPPPCKGSTNHECVAADGGQVAMFFTGLYLVALGTSGMKAALPPLGADQFDEKDPKESVQLSSYFNWFLLSVTVGGIVGVTIVVWISTNQGWDWAFGVCTLAILAAILFVTMGKSLYRNNVPKGSPLLRIIQVIVVTIKNRKLPIPEMADELHEVHDKEAGVLNEILPRTDQFRSSTNMGALKIMFLLILIMEISRDYNLQARQEKRVGGNRAVLFVYVAGGLENMAFIANAVSLVTYLMGSMNFGLTKSANNVTNFMGTSFILALFGGVIADTCFTRFTTGVLFGCFELLGYALLTLQAHLDRLRPTPCEDVSKQCEAPNSGQAAIFYTGLYLVALGTSGVKAALPLLGGDQFDINDPKEAAQLSSFFNWFMFSQTGGSIAGVTFLVWISSNKGWDWAFGVSTLAVLLAIVLLCIGKPFYRDNHHAPKGSPIIRVLQVFVAAIRNQDIPIPKKKDELHEIYDKGTDMNIPNEFLQRTSQFRFLDRAAVNRITWVESAPSMTPGPWRLSTVTQVEETKILLRMLPIVLSTIFINTCLAQLQTFSIQQSMTLDTHILGFKIPAPSLPVIPLTFNFIFIPIYDRIFVPIARRITGIPTGIRYLQRIGVGLVLSTISMAIAGVMETRRKSVAVQHNMVDSRDPLPMSVFWLGFQYAVFGLSEMFTLVGLLEFYHAESSARMKGTSTALLWFSLAFGYFISSVVVEVVNKASGGWLASNNLNRDKLNYFYWLLSVLSALNFVIYLVCASWYKYKNAEMQHEEVSNDD
ncbi:Proton-dependent oligopeptide transporter family [Corchorus capsularis]|uniref:Proton-dependent oligopeptide transporter family n=1 Tax=Corchorus capsularis TaxID=210143 RepID=A0A1R3IYP2_COCAP|nr:Proton-dependent oligopeptide transporter family [Corchorus capsularis]